jgi:hypothetical protein
MVTPFWTLASDAVCRPPLMLSLAGELLEERNTRTGETSHFGEGRLSFSLS